MQAILLQWWLTRRYINTVSLDILIDFIIIIFKHRSSYMNSRAIIHEWVTFDATFNDFVRVFVYRVDSNWFRNSMLIHTRLHSINKYPVAVHLHSVSTHAISIWAGRFVCSRLKKHCICSWDNSFSYWSQLIDIVLQEEEKNKKGKRSIEQRYTGCLI